MDTSRRRRSLERQILEISEAERLRIGREIHEGLGQTLTTIGLLCKALDNRLTPRLKSNQSIFHEMSQNVHRAIQQVRGISKLFFPSPLRDGRIGAALSLLALEISRCSEVPCVLDDGESVQFKDAAAAVQLFGIAQEALHNALRRGGATLLRLRLRHIGPMTELIISDNGKGIFRPRPHADSWSERLMRYRANAIGGRLEVQAATGRGTRVRCVIPMP